jgi:predicted MFS family arabinose efflux permease
MALASSAAHVGVSAGGALGGALLVTAGPGMLPVAAAVLATAALLLFWVAERRHARELSR